MFLEPPATSDAPLPQRPRKPRWLVPEGVPRRLEVADLDLLGVTPGSHALDVGCHVGRLMLRLGRRGCATTGIDIVRGDLLQAPRRLAELQTPTDLIQGDGGRLPFADSSFDFAACTETLEHVADAGLVLREMARVLRPGGRLVVSVPDALPELIAAKVYKLYRLDPFGHRRIFTRDSIVRSVEAVGLRVYDRRLRNSVEAVYWTLLYLFDACPLLHGWGVDALNRWRDRSNEEPYSWLYHVLDKAGNRLLPKSIVVYAEKPRR